MKTFNIHYAKAHLSRLVDLAANGEAFVIAKAGRPLVKVQPLEVTAAKPLQPIGFLKGEFEVPDDFDEMGREEIEDLFGIS